MKYVIVGVSVLLGFGAGVVVVLWTWMAMDLENARRQRDYERQMFTLKDGTIADQKRSIEALEETAAIQDERIRLLQPKSAGAR